MDQNEQCVICHQFNEQMLMLQCVHDPCINCAAIHYAEEFKGKLKNYYYTCQLCGERTPLDISSVIELEKLMPKRVEDIGIKKNVGYRDRESVTSLTKKERCDLNQGLRNETNNRVDNYRDDFRDDRSRNFKQNYEQYDSKSSYSKRAVKMCKDHAQQQVSYYCFKCYQNICPECAIHGVHQGHDVKAHKKAITDVKKQFGLIIESIGRNQDSLRKNKQHYLRKIKQLNDQTNKQKSFVSKQFETLRNQMIVKERQYLRELDQINHRNGSILTTEIDLINKQTQQTNKLIKSIEQTLRRDQITVLEEYGKKNQLFSNEIEKMSVSQVGYTHVPGIKIASLSELKQNLNSVNNTISQIGLNTQDIVFNE